MNYATPYAASVSAQLRALANVSSVKSDAEIAQAITGLDGYVVAYGDVVAQVCDGFAALGAGTANATDWKPFAYPIMQAGSKVMIDSAAKLAARFDEINVPERPPTAPNWTSVRESMLQGTKGAAVTTVSTLGTIAKIGLKSALLRRNPGPAILDHVGRDRIARAVERAKDPVGTLKAAAESLAPKLKQGAELASGLGAELSDALAALIPDDGIEYITADVAAELARSANETSLHAVKGLADSIEDAVNTLSELGKAAVNEAAAQAINDFLKDSKTRPPASRQHLREALTQLAHGEDDAAGLLATMQSVFQKVATAGADVRDQLNADAHTGAATASPPAKPTRTRTRARCGETRKRRSSSEKPVDKSDK